MIFALTDSKDPKDYWYKLKTRVNEEAKIELSTICRRLKLPAKDGKMRETDCTDTKGILRIIQFIPSPKVVDETNYKTLTNASIKKLHKK